MFLFNLWSIAMLRPGQTLALAGPEARHYNHPATARPAPPPRSKCLYWLYLSHFSTEWAEILHDCYLGGKDEVSRQNIDPAALQYSMQHCRISNRTITQPFLIGLSWNLVLLLLLLLHLLDHSQCNCEKLRFHNNGIVMMNLSITAALGSWCTQPSFCTYFLPIFPLWV